MRKNWFVKIVFRHKTGNGRFVLRRRYNDLTWDEIFSVVSGQVVFHGENDYVSLMDIQEVA